MAKSPSKHLRRLSKRRKSPIHSSSTVKISDFSTNEELKSSVTKQRKISHLGSVHKKLKDALKTTVDNLMKKTLKIKDTLNEVVDRLQKIQESLAKVGIVTWTRDEVFDNELIVAVRTPTHHSPNILRNSIIPF
ncbi:hypothetical protein HAX54_018584 [Datura stramonium]|uniref:Uncharacterized protein n=1 Tax=Datura stramonium TaxID=4076 RepID=A0ABS8S239_DATST|nr:hypothetical protein [Datura stramonium]